MFVEYKKIFKNKQSNFSKAFARNKFVVKASWAKQWKIVKIVWCYILSKSFTEVIFNTISDLIPI